VGLLFWDKPEKVMSTEKWKSISADGAPPGVYLPNMTDEDAERWKAKIKYAKTDHPQVEIRKTVRGSQMVLIVALDGWTYRPSGHVVGETREGESNYRHHATEGYQVRMSVNGPLWWKWPDFLDLTIAVHEARNVLTALKESNAEQSSP
jgi:hypothetical protein